MAGNPPRTGPGSGAGTRNGTTVAGVMGVIGSIGAGRPDARGIRIPGATGIGGRDAKFGVRGRVFQVRGSGFRVRKVGFNVRSAGFRVPGA
jgi:hypothetical protein